VDEGSGAGGDTAVALVEFALETGAGVVESATVAAVVDLDAVGLGVAVGADQRVAGVAGVTDERLVGVVALAGEDLAGGAGLSVSGQNESVVAASADQIGDGRGDVVGLAVENVLRGAIAQDGNVGVGADLALGGIGVLGGFAGSRGSGDAALSIEGRNLVVLAGNALRVESGSGVEKVFVLGAVDDVLGARNGGVSVALDVGAANALTLVGGKTDGNEAGVTVVASADGLLAGHVSEQSKVAEFSRSGRIRELEEGRAGGIAASGQIDLLASLVGVQEEARSAEVANVVCTDQSCAGNQTVFGLTVHAGVEGGVLEGAILNGSSGSDLGASSASADHGSLGGVAIGNCLTGVENSLTSTSSSESEVGLAGHTSRLTRIEYSSDVHKSVNVTVGNRLGQIHSMSSSRAGSNASHEVFKGYGSIGSSESDYTSSSSSGVDGHDKLLASTCASVTTENGVQERRETAVLNASVATGESNTLGIVCGAGNPSCSHSPLASPAAEFGGGVCDV